MWSSGFGYRLLLSLALLALTCGRITAQQTPLPSSTQNIAQLKDSLTQALSLCTTLQQNLALRIESFQALQASYERLVQTQQDLQRQISTLQQSLSNSDSELQQAQADLQTTRELSASLQLSLDKASTSLASYKADTDRAIVQLQFTRDVWKYVAIGAVIALGGETVWLLARR